MSHLEYLHLFHPRSLSESIAYLMPSCIPVRDLPRMSIEVYPLSIEYLIYDSPCFIEGSCFGRECLSLQILCDISIRRILEEYIRIRRVPALDLTSRIREELVHDLVYVSLVFDISK